jgi:hypothetical protein
VDDEDPVSTSVDIENEQWGGYCREEAAIPAPITLSALDRESAVFPGVEAAVQIDRLTAMGVEELGDTSRTGTDCADADNRIIHFVNALDQLIHWNMD